MGVSPIGSLYLWWERELNRMLFVHYRLADSLGKVWQIRSRSPTVFVGLEDQELEALKGCFTMTGETEK